MSMFGGIVVAQILLRLFGIWMIGVKCLVEYQACLSPYKATHCKVRDSVERLAAATLFKASVCHVVSC